MNAATLLTLAACAVLLASPSVAQVQAPPKLLVVISVDQFSADLWDEYRPQFTGGFARFASGTDRAALAGLGPGGALLGATSAELRRLGLGDTITLAGGLTVTVSGVVSDSAVGGAELVLDTATPAMQSQCDTGRPSFGPNSPTTIDATSGASGTIR